jgi:hypothetical protein
MGLNSFSTKKWRRLLPLFAGVALSGCQVAHMALPDDLQNETSELAVEGRSLLIFKDSFQFGPYQVADVHRGWTRGGGHSLSIGETEFGSSEAEQKYEFAVNEQESPARIVRCATTADWSQMETEGFLGGRFGVEFSSNQQLVCILKQNGGGKPAKLVMSRSASANETALQGIMVDGATRIDISGTHGLDSTPLQVSTPTGYIFQIGGRSVGAVEVINAGTVWLDNSATPETRSTLAAASAVLLLYQDIQQTSEK